MKNLIMGVIIGFVIALIIFKTPASLAIPLIGLLMFLFGATALLGVYFVLNR